jgi:hypothetical protein
MHRDERLIVLPQTISATIEGKQLQNALEVHRFPLMTDERDEPGTVESGRSRIDDNHRYSTQAETHPVPLYGSNERIRISRGGDGHGFYETEQRNFDVIQVTRTPMSPAVAKAFKHALAEDPTHPFVLSHLMDGMDLNGSDSWLTVGGPALAIPLTRLEPRDARSRRSKVYIQPEPDGEDVEMQIHVNNPLGLSSEDFISAARHHESLGPHGIIIGAVELASLEPISHRMGDEALTGEEVAMFKLAYDNVTIGLYPTAEEAGAALKEELGIGSRYRNKGTLFTGSPRSEFHGRYSVEGCLVLDGEEVRRSVDTELLEARATVKARVAFVDPGARRAHAGWMLVWQAYDWHRNPEQLTQYLAKDGKVLSERRSRWGY